MAKKIIKIGSRKSKLALIQTEMVIKGLKKHYPDIECQIVPIITTGDIIKNKALYEIGGKALFLKEIENELMNGTIDLAVHSLKDVPCKLPIGLTIGAVLEQEDAREVLVSKNGYRSLEELPKGSVIGTSSVRRKIIIQNKRPDFKIVPFRGNVDTRLKKVLQGEVDATILAYCGLKRLESFDFRYCSLLDIEEMIPPVGQGVIAIEIKNDDREMIEICNKLNHMKTEQLIKPGRTFLEYIDADCKTPIAAYSIYKDDENLYTSFMLADLKGDKILYDNLLCNVHDNALEVINIAKKMMNMVYNKN